MPKLVIWLDGNERFNVGTHWGCRQVWFYSPGWTDQGEPVVNIEDGTIETPTRYYKARRRKAYEHIEELNAKWRRLLAELVSQEY